MVLEEILQANEDNNDGTPIHQWTRQYLSYLYTLTKEHDVVHSLSAGTGAGTGAGEQFKHAMDLERSGDRKSALLLYTQLYTGNSSSSSSNSSEEEAAMENYEQYQVQKGMLSCASALQQWGVIEEHIVTPHHDNKGGYSLLWNDRNATTAATTTTANNISLLNSHETRLANIGYYIQHCLHSRSNSNMKHLLQFMENALDTTTVANNSSSSSSSSSSNNNNNNNNNNSSNNNNNNNNGSRREFILEHFPGEAALTFMVQGKYDRALPLLEFAIDDVSRKV